MRKSILTLALLAVCMLVNAQENKYEKYFKNVPFPMKAFSEPQFPKNEVSLKDFGAVGDGQSLCTEAFEKAVDALTKKGGGRLIVPEGVWLTGPIVLKSNINLHIKEGAIILFSPDESSIPSWKLLSKDLTPVVHSRRSLPGMLRTLPSPVVVSSMAMVAGGVR